jgi:hypothetical protein
VKNVLGTETTLNDTYLDGMREIQDPPADQVALGMVTRGDHVLFADLVRKHQVWEVDGQPCVRLPEDVRRYLIESAALPKWARREIVTHGEDFFLQYGISSATLLACASLPECYLMRHGTEVLCFTKFLQLDPARRIRETALMIMSVMSTGGLMPHKGVGLGVRSTQKVRLMHATIRCMIDREPGIAANPTDPALQKAMGRPINQEDLVFTLMTFSYVAVQGFQRLGVPMTRRQQDAYVHCWNVVGYMMGIREELLPDGIDQAKLLYDTIMRRQAGTSPAGQQLQRALTKLLVDLMPPGLKSLPVELTRKLVGDEHATQIGLTPSPARDRALIAATLLLWRLTVRVGSLLHSVRPYRYGSERIHKLLLDRMGNLPGHAPFNIPPEFIAQWFPERPAPSATSSEKSGTY